LDTDSEINSCRVRFIHNKGGAGPEQVNIDCARLEITRAGAINFRLDREYQWTNAVYDGQVENICFYLTGSVDENLLVHYWDGDSWESLGTISDVGWSNFTATGLTSSTYTIRLTDATQSSDATQNQLDYRLYLFAVL
jgi:hypothetical protein